ncbi:hypothetical protein [Comamonas thiooxydans]|uniref:hypothetical protein n=1 Tax=Comamonas thiooxydans TaxID=363952 RepID=UPI0021155455|nr:hypothetical protein [Comamonas thiooxydans]UUE94309.1 hypothetical protein MJ608_01105 [Comamonas thiooxydans]
MRQASQRSADIYRGQMSPNYVRPLGILCSNAFNNQIDSKDKIPGTENNILRGKMDDYYKLAAAYFKEFEPRSSFPGLKSYHWYLSIFLFALFFYFGYEFFFAEMPSADKPFWQFLGAEIAFLLSCALIAIERMRLTVRATSEDSDLRPIERLAMSKRSRLEALLERPAWKFMATAKEIIELRALEKACRSTSDKDFDELLPKIYDPESKARLLTLMTALIGLVIAFLGKSEALNFMETMGDEGTWAFLKALAQLAVVTFVACVVAYQVLRQIYELVLYLFSSLFPVLHNRQVTLDYLLRDLIQLHRAEPPVLPSTEAPHKANTVSARHMPFAPSVPARRIWTARRRRA